MMLSKSNFLLKENSYIYNILYIYHRILGLDGMLSFTQGMINMYPWFITFFKNLLYKWTTNHKDGSCAYVYIIMLLNLTHVSLISISENSRGKSMDMLLCRKKI